ncbi:MAG: VWA domain-containing protein [Streptosporangiales bacterium]|nr:VWA domain-containing protein [Streptosporangiales bacterium]
MTPPSTRRRCVRPRSRFWTTCAPPACSPSTCEETDMTVTGIEPTDLGVCGRLGDEHGALPLTAVEIEGDVCELVATTTVRQTFRNTRDTALEATYVFPLPDRAGVTSFVADLAGRVVEGRLDERGRARQEYDEAVAAGHRAAIAEEERPGVFTMRVGNLLPGEEAVVTLTMTGPLPVDDGVAEYRFPLVVAPRYVPGVPLGGADVGTGVARDTDRVPDASRITPPVLLPGQESPVALSLRATLRVPGLATADLASTLHNVETREADGAVEVELRPGERLDRDVLLRWPVAADVLRTTALVTVDGDGDAAGGTWQVTVVPPAPPATSRPRDVVVVLDRSGSMSGWKMVAARRAAARVVDTLGTRDRFAVLAFDNTVERPPEAEGLAAATDRSRWSAVSWLAELQARGGTDLLASLREAVGLLADDSGESRDRYVVLVTDGQVGNEDEVLRALQPAAGRVRVFALGIDRAVNAGFLRRIASVGAGRCDLVESEDRLDGVVADLHRRIAPPVATGLTVTADRVELLADETAPGRAPDLFPGVPVTVAGRFAGRPAGDVRFTVTADGLTERVTATTVDSMAVRTVWARARVRDLEDSYASARPGDEELADRIVAVSLAHGVLSRFTAFVAVDRDRRTGSTSPQPVTQPVELPSGWAPQPAGGAMPMMAMRAATDLAAPAAGQAFGHAAPGPARAQGRRGGRGRESVAVPPVTDTYRPRVEELLERLDRDDHDALAADVDVLVDDLVSVGAPDAWCDALRDLARALRGEAGADLPSAVQAVRALLADGTQGTRGGDRRARFWRT